MVHIKTMKLYQNTYINFRKMEYNLKWKAYTLSLTFGWLYYCVHILTRARALSYPVYDTFPCPNGFIRFLFCFIEWSNNINVAVSEKHTTSSTSKHKSKLWVISRSHSFSCNHLEFLSEIIIRSFIKCGSSINCVRLNTRCVFICFRKSILWHRNKLGSMIAQPPLSLSLLPYISIYKHACVWVYVCVWACYCASVYCMNVTFPHLVHSRIANGIFISTSHLEWMD